jgi:hypothetical protein
MTTTIFLLFAGFYLVAARYLIGLMGWNSKMELFASSENRSYHLDAGTLSPSTNLSPQVPSLNSSRFPGYLS